VLIFLVSTVTTEQVFLVMNIVEIRLCNKIKYEFLTNFLMVYIEREVDAIISIDSIIDNFQDSKK
jgi:hypothetical protein